MTWSFRGEIIRRRPVTENPEPGNGHHWLEHFPITLTPLVSLPGLTGQSITHGWYLLDRPVKPGDDSELCVPT
jgi:hypothetical protein